jgi:hypothetical protein
LWYNGFLVGHIRRKGRKLREQGTNTAQLAPSAEAREPRVKRPPEVVYFVGSEETQLIKIGSARDVRSRFSALQTGSAETLHLLGVIRDEDPKGLERFLHSRFSGSRVRGEWFRPTDPLIRLIEAEAISLEEDDRQRMRAIVERVTPPPAATGRPRKPGGTVRGHRKALAAYKAERGIPLTARDEGVR